MSTQAIKQINESPKYAENILPICANFNDAFTWNIVSGAAVIANSNSRMYAGDRSLLINFSTDEEVVFNRGNSDFSKTINRGGYHILSYRVYKSDPESTVNLKVNVYLDGVPAPQNIIEKTFNSADGFTDYNWNAYTQIIFIGDGELLDFSFSAQSDIIGSKLYIDGFSLLLNDRELSPLNAYREVEEVVTTIETTETIDVPSIASNSSYTVVMTVTGAVLGDFITGFIYPIQLITLDLVVGQPIVTDTDEVSFIIHNHTGGSVNPASGDYTIKIVK